jgi:hypothetical protein
MAYSGRGGVRGAQQRSPTDYHINNLSQINFQRTIEIYWNTQPCARCGYPHPLSRCRQETPHSATRFWQRLGASGLLQQATACVRTRSNTPQQPTDPPNTYQAPSTNRPQATMGYSMNAYGNNGPQPGFNPSAAPFVFPDRTRSSDRCPPNAPGYGDPVDTHPMYSGSTFVPGNTFVPASNQSLGGRRDSYQSNALNNSQGLGGFDQSPRPYGQYGAAPNASPRPPSVAPTGHNPAAQAQRSAPTTSRHIDERVGFEKKQGRFQEKINEAQKEKFGVLVTPKRPGFGPTSNIPAIFINHFVLELPRGDLHH